MLPMLSVSKAKAEKFLKLYKKLDKAQAEAEYKCAAFTEPYAPAEKPAKAKKAATKKATKSK